MTIINKTLSVCILSMFLTPYPLLANEASSWESKGISLPSFSKNTQEKKQALIVGVSDYAQENADLNGIDKDVEKMRQLFTKWGFDVTVLFDAESMNILEYLTKYSKTLNANDSFAFYYTGHGSHKVDNNNDESDGQDETLVLSDGNVNTHLIDDILYKKFNDIKAKKLVFFDSCHSGTVFRSLGNKSPTQTKAIKPEEVTESFRLSSSKGLSVGDNMKGSDFVTFSSSRDTEESLATPTGSLFTNAISEIFSDNSLQNKSLNSINDILVKKVLAYAKQTDGIPHHPSINYSNSSIGNQSLQRFIQSKAVPSSVANNVVAPAVSSNMVQGTFEDMISSNKLKTMSLNYNKTTYQTGEPVEFTVDTQGDRGYLTVFYIDKSDVTVLYPNPFVQNIELQGRYSFPRDLANGQFELEAYKSCNGCSQEKTTIYTLLSAKPISDINSIQSKGLVSFGNNSGEAKVMSRAVRIKATPKSNSAFIPQLGKYEFMVK